MITVNLIPAKIQQSTARRRRVRAWSITFAIASLLVLGALAVEWTYAGRADRLEALSRQLYAELADVRASLGEVTAESGQVLLQIERARALRDKRPWSGLISLVGSCMPPKCWLRLIATDPERPAPEIARSAPVSRPASTEQQGTIALDAPRRLRIAGFAPDAAHPHEFVTNLKRAGTFTAITLSGTQRRPVLDGSYYHFEIVCEW